jgi:hypothetical protein
MNRKTITSTKIKLLLTDLKKGVSEKVIKSEFNCLNNYYAIYIKNITLYIHLNKKYYHFLKINHTPKAINAKPTR